MRVSLAWLRTLCDAGCDAAVLADRLTRQGLEVAAVCPVPAPSERIVAARLAEIAPLPRSNLKRIRVEAGAAGGYVVVSAAPNVAAGMCGALALPGASLPDGRVIGAREYAGERSEAMLCSPAEIGLGEVSDRLLELPAATEPGLPVATVYGLPDACLEIELTPNRGDCLSMLGIAREVHAGTGAALTPPPLAPVAAVHAERLEVTVADAQACPRYLGRVITQVDPRARTPLWLAERLRRAGLRAGHPVVDVLNYVMLELGQPLHAFDREVLQGGITVRRARGGERLELLGGTTVALDPDMLVIADAARPVALAGVLGGAASAVQAHTRSVFLESAFFAPEAVRGRARRLGLSTEAAHRFERGVDPELAHAALERASALIGEIAGGSPGEITAAEAPESLPRRADLAFRPALVARLAGLVMEPAEARDILRRLGFATEADAEGGLLVRAPSARFDIEGEADLVEEVARIAGYERIAEVAPNRRMTPSRAAAAQGPVRRMRAVLTTHGYHEAVTMSFAAPERDAALAPRGRHAPALRNPLSAPESVLRTTLWTGLLEALAHNVARQEARVRLFETGTVFAADGTERSHVAGVACGASAPEQWGIAARALDFYDAKGEVEMLLAAAGAVGALFEGSQRAALAAGRRGRARIGAGPCAEFGVLAPRLAAQWDLPAATILFEIDLSALPPRAPVRAEPVPRFPAVRRDLALVVPDVTSAAELLAGVHRHGSARLAEVRIFDTYAGSGIPPGARGIALGLIFRDFSRTLTDAEVDAAVSAIVAGLGEEMGAYVRS